jgi:hypothetical protein
MAVEGSVQDSDKGGSPSVLLKQYRRQAHSSWSQSDKPRRKQSVSPSVRWRLRIMSVMLTQLCCESATISAIQSSGMLSSDLDDVDLLGFVRSIIRVSAWRSGSLVLKSYG